MSLVGVDLLRVTTWRAYYWLLLRSALTSGWSIFSSANFAIAFVAWGLAKRYPAWEAALNDLAWQIPAGLGLGVIAIRWIVAPFEVHKQLTSQLRASEARRDETAPRFDIAFCGIKPIKVDEKVKQLHGDESRFTFNVHLEIKDLKRRPASNVGGRFVVTEHTLLQPAVINGVIEEGYDEMRGFVVMLEAIIPQNQPACFIALRVDYVDEATEQPLRQTWYWKWPGSKDGVFQGDWHNMNKNETDRMVPYLKSVQADWTR